MHIISVRVGSAAITPVVNVEPPSTVNASLKNINISGEGSAKNAVLYDPQTLTDAQKEQARTNIGAVGADEIPQSTSDLTNDSGFITRTVNDLANYYLKSETYTKEELDNKLSAIPKFSIEVVSSLPTSGISDTTVYLVASGDEKDNLYTEYIYVNGEWEYLGKQTVDLTDYVKRTELSSYYTKAEMDELLNTVKNSIPTKLSQLTADSTHRTVTDAEKSTWNAKQPAGDYATSEELDQLSEEIADLPNNKTLIDNVTENVKFVKSPENPIFVTSEDDMTDSSKVYVYNGYIYQYGTKKEEVVVPGETVITPARAVIVEGCRWSGSGAKFSALTTASTLIIPASGKTAPYAIELTGMSVHSGYNGVYGGSPIPANGTGHADADVNDTSFNVHTSADCLVLAINRKGTSGEYNGAYITIDGEVIDDIVITSDATNNAYSLIKQKSTTTTEETTEIIETKGFYNTGCAFAPADYEERIIKLESKIGIVDEDSIVHNSIGKTFPPSQKPAETAFDGYDVDVPNATADTIYAYIDNSVNGKKTVTKEILGKDASGKYDIARYIYANREHYAWQRSKCPKMYAWKNGSNVIYSTSISPRIGDTMYSTPYIGTAYSTVTAVNATNRSRIANGLEFVRYESGDVEPAVIYTDADDERNSNTSITKDGITYNRYPMGDLGANKRKLIPIFIYANEHGIIKDITSSYQYETKMCALVASRLLRDLGTDKQSNNPLYKYIRENCMMVVIPVANPYGYNYNVSNDDNGLGGYYTANKVNINRNYDTPGWDYMIANGTGSAMGSYAGSENETQYIMNTMVESGAVVAMSLHGLGGMAGICAHQGQSPDGTDYNQEKLSKVVAFLKNNYGYTLQYYDDEPVANMPDVTAKSPSYITQCGAYGGIVELQPDDVKVSGYAHEMKDNVIENAYAQVLNLTAMWLSDYLEQ